MQTYIGETISCPRNRHTSRFGPGEHVALRQGAIVSVSCDPVGSPSGRLRIARNATLNDCEKISDVVGTLQGCMSRNPHRNAAPLAQRSGLLHTAGGWRRSPGGSDEFSRSFTKRKPSVPPQGYYEASVLRQLTELTQLSSAAFIHSGRVGKSIPGWQADISSVFCDHRR